MVDTYLNATIGETTIPSNVTNKRDTAGALTSLVKRSTTAALKEGLQTAIDNKVRIYAHLDLVC